MDVKAFEYIYVRKRRALLKLEKALLMQIQINITLVRTDG